MLHILIFGLFIISHFVIVDYVFSKINKTNRYITFTMRPQSNPQELVQLSSFCCSIFILVLIFRLERKNVKNQQFS